MYSPNVSQAAKELDADFAGWAAGLEDDEREALAWYQFGGSDDLNPVLRALGEPNPTPDEARLLDSLSDDRLDELMIYAEAINRAISKGRLQDSITVYRGYRNRGFLRYLPLDELEGREFHDGAFVSTSIAEFKARTRLDPRNGFLLRFVIPKGRNAAWMPGLELGKYDAQRELLLPRDWTWKITRATEEAGVLCVVGELL